MARFGPKFVDKKDEISGPFNGCLIVLNINDNTKIGQEYRKNLSEAVSNAQADGHAVLHLFDSRLGVTQETEFLPHAESHDFYMLLSSFASAQNAEFSLVPSIRNLQIKNIFESIFACQQFSFMNKKGAIIGRCTIDGDEVFLPYIEI